jgi:hypothetical protein
VTRPSESSRWAAPFSIAREHISSFLTRSGKPLVGIGQLPLGQIRDVVNAALEEVVVLSEDVCDLLFNLLQRPLRYAQTNYSSDRQFIETIYDECARPLDPVMPICLTGLEGTGKTQIACALERLLRPQHSVSIHGHGRHDILPFKRLVFGRQWGHAAITRILGRPPGGDPSTLARWLYGNGVCFLAVDEMQFFTQGETSNARTAKLLLEIASWGKPWLYAANFSLIRKLRKRPPEEQDRLLENCQVLVPEGPDDPSWARLLREYQTVLQHILSFRLLDHREELWNLTAGVKRYLRMLLSYAVEFVRHAGKAKLSWDDLIAAHRSSGFSVTRGNVRCIIEANLSATKELTPQHRDFVSPLESAAADSYRFHLKVARDREVAAMIAEAALSPAEKKLYRKRTQPTTESAPGQRRSKKTGKVRKVPRDAASLTTAGLQFQAHH